MRLIGVTRVCIKCGETKFLAFFPEYRNRKKEIAYCNVCKVCSRVYKIKYYQNNRQECLNRSKAQRERNPEGYKKYLRKYYRKNVEKFSIYAKMRYKEKSDQINACRREWRERTDIKMKEKIHKLVRSQIKLGLLKRPENCECCGRKIFVEGHHEDYSKPLDVKWLCKKCHENIHHLNEGDNSEE